MHRNPLEKLGLTKNESDVYETLLERGELTPSQIALLTGLTRENTYNIAGELIEKGLAEKIPSRKIITYRLLDPSNLRVFLETQKQKVETGEKVLNDLYPELSNLYKLSSLKGGVAYFKGVEGIKYVFGGLFFDPKPSEILAFRSPQDNVIEDFMLEHILEQTKKGIKAKIIAPKSEKISTNINGVKLLREIRYVDSKDYIFPAEISISGTKVCIASYGKKKGAVVLDDAEIAQTFTSLFNLIWKHAKE